MKPFLKLKSIVSNSKWVVLASLPCLGLLAKATVGAQQSSSGGIDPEADSAQVSRKMVPISDEQWNAALSASAQQKYEILSGDTLYSLSQRLFGDSKYWPKLFALNNSKITNPHLIQPGVLLHFHSDLKSAPTLSLSAPEAKPVDLAQSPAVPAERDPASSTGIEMKKTTEVQSSSEVLIDTLEGGAARSEEWKLLPRQSWESVSTSLPDRVDRFGIDSDSRILTRTAKPADLPLLSETKRLPISGRIIAARNENSSITLGETVLVESAEEMQIGSTYSITTEPSVLQASQSGRVGFQYPILGRAQIVDARDNLYIAQIEFASDFIPRGSLLIPQVNQFKVDLNRAVPAAAPIEGVILPNPDNKQELSVQNKTVVIDQGREDGVKPGMVFRSFQYEDPSNTKKITQADFLIQADFFVIHASEHFSTAVSLQSRGPVPPQTKVVLLTSVKDLIKNPGYLKNSLSNKNELDELEAAEGGKPLNPEEKRELEQLEKWKGNPDPAELPPATEVAPKDAPVDGATPIPVEPSLEAPPTDAAVESAPAGEASAAPAPVESKPETSAGSAGDSDQARELDQLLEDSAIPTTDVTAVPPADAATAPTEVPSTPPAEQSEIPEAELMPTEELREPSSSPSPEPTSITAESLSPESLDAPSSPKDTTPNNATPAPDQNESSPPKSNELKKSSPSEETPKPGKESEDAELDQLLKN